MIKVNLFFPLANVTIKLIFRIFINNNIVKKGYCIVCMFVTGCSFLDCFSEPPELSLFQRPELFGKNKGEVAEYKRDNRKNTRQAKKIDSTA